MRRRRFLESFGLLFAISRLRGQTKALGGAADQQLAAAAKDFIAALRPELHSRLRFAMDDPERKDWSNLPHFIHPRKGIRLGEMTPAEREAAHRLLQAILSSQGYYKAT